VVASTESTKRELYQQSMSGRRWWARNSSSSSVDDIEARAASFCIHLPHLAQLRGGFHLLLWLYTREGCASGGRAIHCLVCSPFFNDLPATSSTLLPCHESQTHRSNTHNECMKNGIRSGTLGAHRTRTLLYIETGCNQTLPNSLWYAFDSCPSQPPL